MELVRFQRLVQQLELQQFQVQVSLNLHPISLLADEQVLLLVCAEVKQTLYRQVRVLGRARSISLAAVDSDDGSKEWYASRMVFDWEYLLRKVLVPVLLYRATILLDSLIVASKVPYLHLRYSRIGKMMSEGQILVHSINRLQRVVDEICPLLAVHGRSYRHAIPIICVHYEGIEALFRDVQRLHPKFHPNGNLPHPSTVGKSYSESLL